MAMIAGFINKQHFFKHITHCWIYLSFILIGGMEVYGADTLKIGADFNYPPYSYLNAQGEVKGHDIEILNEIADIVGFDKKMYAENWDIILKKLETGEIDIIAGIVYSEERDKIYDFTNPIQTMYYSIFAHEDSEINDVDDLRGKKGVTLKGDIVNNKFLKPMGLLEDVTYVNSLPEAVMLVEWGQYDYVLAPYSLGMRTIDEQNCKYVRVEGPPILPSVYCLAVREGKHELVASLNYAIQQLRNTGQLQEIDDKWIEYTRKEEKYEQLLTYALIFLGVLMLITILVMIWLNSLKRQVKRKTHEIKLTEKGYSNIFNSANDGMLILDLDGNIIEANVQAYEMFGHAKGELTGYNLSELTSNSYQHLVQAFLENTWKGHSFYSEIVQCRQDGSAFHADIKGNKVIYHGNDQLLAIIRDITFYNETKKTLENARQQAEQANRLKTNFFSHITHELRTPLNAILGYTYLLKNTDLSIAQEDYLYKLLNSSNLLLQIIEDILDASKIEAGKFQLELAPFELKHVIKNVSDVITYDAEAKGLRLAIDVCEHVPSGFLGDALRLQQVLINLCKNAINHTEQGEVKITVSVKEQWDNKVRLVFSISDTGTGIKKEDMHKLFKAFSQIKSDGKTGTGLGLMISKHLAQLMQGDLTFESEYGEGTTFYFNPVLSLHSTAEIQHDNDTKETEQVNLDALEHLAGTRILLVDDNEFNIQVAQKLLELKQMIVVPAYSGKKALEIIKDNKSIDLILMDLQMPGMDGYKTTQAVRTITGYENVPVIALSAYNMAKEKDKCLAFGINDYIAKPFEPDLLYASISHNIKNNQHINEYSVNSHNTSPNFKSDIIDIKKVLNAMGGDTNIYFVILKRYIKEYDRLSTSVKELLNTKDFDGLANLAHNAKNAFGMVGAYQFIQYAQIIEDLSNAEDYDQLSKQVPSFVDIISKVNNAVHTVLQQHDWINMS